MKSLLLNHKTDYFILIYFKKYVGLLIFTDIYQEESQRLDYLFIISKKCRLLFFYLLFGQYLNVIQAYDLKYNCYLCFLKMLKHVSRHIGKS